MRYIPLNRSIGAGPGPVMVRRPAEAAVSAAPTSFAIRQAWASRA
jgi:hypothetical protein